MQDNRHWMPACLASDLQALLEERYPPIPLPDRASSKHTGEAAASHEESAILRQDAKETYSTQVERSDLDGQIGALRDAVGKAALRRGRGEEETAPDLSRKNVQLRDVLDYYARQDLLVGGAQ